MASRRDSATPAGQRRRLALGATPRRLKYESRISIWLTVLALPAIFCTGILVYGQSSSVLVTLLATIALAVVWALAATYFFEQLVRPLQTLTNIVSSLREDDFSFRARGAYLGDSLGDLAIEINALANSLQYQRSMAQDALSLVEQVMTSMQSPVLAFDSAGYLRLLNPAAEEGLQLKRQRSLGCAAADLDLTTLLDTGDEEIYVSSSSTRNRSPNAARWSVRRATFRLHGVPHSLFVLSDVAAALREEERLAWQRLIRVLSHEINNSLTPIKSIAGSLRTRLPQLDEDASSGSNYDLHRGLTVIEDRAASLNRFLQAYQQLTRLPAPQLQQLSLGPLLEQVVALETRLPVEIQPGPLLHLMGDPDQLQQLLINLIHNAVEAALSAEASAPFDPHVVVTWEGTPSQIILHIRDNGPGLMNDANLFVPFYTTKPGGSGIGLVLAQQIASAHKGTVVLFNNTGASGCTAELRLPAEPVPVCAAE